MASEDVIELGSSDDETEPAPKKSKPLPNAMVCIPRKLHEVTIKPAKLNLASANRGVHKIGTKGIPTKLPTAKAAPTPKAVVTSSKGVLLPGNATTVRAIPAFKKATVIKHPNILTNPFASKSQPNGKPAQKISVKPHLKLVKPVTIQKITNSSAVISRLSNSTNVGNAAQPFLKNPININNPHSLSNLPPSITVRRTMPSTHKSLVFLKAVTFNKPNVNPKQNTEVPTVELDDDEGSPPTTTTASHPWYIRPEEEVADPVPTLEQENNSEPTPPQMIEITIEDSPIKPVQNKRMCEVGTELAITIDDSPVKNTVDKNADLSGSDNEKSTNTESKSKKKLDYPKEAQNDSRKTVEIEIDIPLDADLDMNVGEKSDDVCVEVESIPNNSNEYKNNITSNENKTEIPNCSVQSEFHPVYQHFINACFELENSEDMNKIVEKKIKAYYRQVPKEYSESEEFIDMVASKITAMKASPEKMYLYIKDIVDELNMQRKIAKSQIINMDTKNEDNDQFLYGEVSEYYTKRQRQIRKLEKTIKKLHRAIQKLEEQEVDFDDEDDSVYLLTERYKERMVRVYTKFCQLTNTKMPSEPRIVIDARPGRPPGPAKRLEKWINKKVPIGTPLPFPDFHDVLRCVRDANDEDKLGWNEVDVMEEARDLFTRCGKKLQRRRQENEWRLAASRITLDVDPAENNEQLKCKLAENMKLAAIKETEIFNKYADRQNQLKLEPVEIGDKEAEESPVESEEEEVNDDERLSLENKDKRKERIKRLLQEKSKRANDDKENLLSKEETTAEDVKKNEEVATIKETETNANEINKDPENLSEKSPNKDLSSNNKTETLSLSSGISNDLESDIDELHLLQKLHSGTEAHSSTLESSDSDSPIAISDSIDSGSDSKKQLSDVISIENSSYSESEVDKDDKLDTVVKNADSVNVIPIVKMKNDPETNSVVVVETETSNNVSEASTSNTAMEIDCPSTSTKEVNSKFKNNECNEPVEDVLLASSDEENSGSQEDRPSSVEAECINLKDDLISIDETFVGSNVSKGEEDIEIELAVIDTGGVRKEDTPRVVEKIYNNVDLEDDQFKEKQDTIELIDSSQKETASPSKDASIQMKDNTVSNDSRSAKMRNIDQNQV